MVSIVIPSPTGHGGGQGASGGVQPPWLNRTPGSMDQVRPSADTAEKTCHP